MQTPPASFNPITGTGPSDEEIRKTKELRVELDASLQKMKGLVYDETAQQACLRLKESIMWLGMHLKELGTSNPYPNSYKPENAIVDKTADGLKL
jgi:hypothetical protein